MGRRRIVLAAKSWETCRHTATSKLTPGWIRSNSRSWLTISSSTAWTLSLHRLRRRCHSLNPLTLTLMEVQTGRSHHHPGSWIQGEIRTGRRVRLIAFQVTVMQARTLTARSIQLVQSTKSRSIAKLRTIQVDRVWTPSREGMHLALRPVPISPRPNLHRRRQVYLSIVNFYAIKTISRLILNCQLIFTMTSGTGLRIS